MSAFAGKADIEISECHVRSWPFATVVILARRDQLLRFLSAIGRPSCWFVSTDGEKHLLKSVIRLIAAQFLCGLTEGFHHITRIAFSYVRHLVA